MCPRKLGVVFGPTLLRLRDPTKEFSDTAGMALSVEWLVEHAPVIFEA
jgi:Rho-type GTPase-activating protein 1/2